MTGYPNENCFWHHTGLKGIDGCMDTNVYTINVRFKKIIDLRYRFVYMQKTKHKNNDTRPLRNSHDYIFRRTI